MTYRDESSRDTRKFLWIVIALILAAAGVNIIAAMTRLAPQSEISTEYRGKV